MISTSQLLNKLSNIKSSQKAKQKEYNTLQNNLLSFEKYSLDSLNNFQNQLQILNSQLNQMKKSNKQNQLQAIKKLQIFQCNLQHTLKVYQQKQYFGQQKLNQLIQKIQSHLENHLLTTSKTNHQLILSYNQLLTRVQSCHKTILTMQFNIKKKYQELRIKINKLMKGIEDSLMLDVQEVYLKTDLFIQQLDKIELNVRDQLGQINTHKQKKRLQIHETIQQIIAQMTNAHQHN